MKTETWWCIKEPDDEWDLGTISRTAHEARRCVTWMPSLDWKGLYKMGYRCVKVEIREVEK